MAENYNLAGEYSKLYRDMFQNTEGHFEWMSDREEYEDSGLETECDICTPHQPRLRVVMPGEAA